MKLIPLILSAALLSGMPAVHGRTPETSSKSQPTNAAPMNTGVRRHTTIVEIKPDKVDACKKLYAGVPGEVTAAYKAAGFHNLTRYLKELGGKHFLISYFEYAGRDYAGDTARLASRDAVKTWQQALADCQVSPQSEGDLEDVEEVFYTAGAAAVVPVPKHYKRIGMITGLKPEKEADYRTLHATTWPGVLKGIKDGNLRNFTIRLAELDGALYLIGYLEYVGSDSAADDAAGKALPVNKRWWKFTDACQKPLPAAAAKGEIWDGLEEIQHLD